MRTKRDEKEKSFSRKVANAKVRSNEQESFFRVAWHLGTRKIRAELIGVWLETRYCSSCRGIVARVPAKVHAKLLIAFLAIMVLLIALGAVGLQALNDTNRRAKDLVELQRKIAAYRQLQHDTTAQLYSVASALLVHDDRTLDATLRQLNQFGYDLDRLQFVAKDEVELLGQVRKDYEQFIKVVSQAIELIRGGKIAEGNKLQIAQANPLAERLERLMNQLVNRAEADMVASIEASDTAYIHSRRIVIGIALGSIALALASRLRDLLVGGRAGQ